MSRAFVECNAPYDGAPRSQCQAQVVDFVHRLAAIHPLLTDISPVGNKNGFKSMLAQPLVREMNEAQWEKLFKQNGEHWLDGRVDSGGYRIGFWNRQKGSAAFISFDLSCCGQSYDTTTLTDLPDDLVTQMSDLPDRLVTEPLLMALMQAEIESFNATNAEIMTARNDEEPYMKVWRLWLSARTPWPGPDNLRVKPEQGAYSQSQPFLDGTLYTWPEYAPWRYLPAAAKTS